MHRCCVIFSIFLFLSLFFFFALSEFALSELSVSLTERPGNLKQIRGDLLFSTSVGGVFMLR